MQVTSHNFFPYWENSDLSVLLPDGIYLFSEALAKLKIFEPNLTNNTPTISLPLSSLSRRNYATAIIIVTSLTKCVCRYIVGGEIRSPMKHCLGCLQNLLQPIRSTAQIWIVTKNKNPSPVGVEVALSTGCTWGVHVQVDRVKYLVRNSGFVQSHK